MSGDRRACGRRGPVARVGVQSRAGGVHAAEGAVAAQSRARRLRPPRHGAPRQGFRSAAAHRRARHGAVRGVRAITPGEAVSSWGTSGTVLAPTAEPRVDPGLRAHTFCHVAPGVWYVMGVVLSAGGAFAWYRDQLARELADTDQRDARLVDEAASVPPGAEGVTFLPYLQGERTPHRDASLRAAFVGLSLAHSRAHLTRAVLEGVCFAMRDCVAILQELDMTPKHLLLTGGGAKSAFIRRLQADIFGLPVTTVNREEGPAYGAALLAAVGVGAFPDLKAAVQCTLTRSPLTEPDRDVHGAYQAIYESFRERFRAS